MAFLMNPLRGESRLLRVFWLYGVLAAVPALIAAFIVPQSLALGLIPFVVGVAGALYFQIALWRCAYNTERRWLGPVVRIAAALSTGVLLIIATTTIVQTVSPPN